jgi:glycosyltransferase involved in cell wall biosynthesis
MPPIAVEPAGKREPYIITLAGAPNKNLVTVLRAFALFRKRFPEFRLIVLGSVNLGEEAPGELPPGVSFEAMERYPHHLAHCSALVFYSRSEGLGLPPIEAMSCGCPLVLSDIAPLRETCGEAGAFGSPEDGAECARALTRVVSNLSHWEKQASRGWKQYCTLAGDSLAAFTECTDRNAGRQ